MICGTGTNVVGVNAQGRRLQIGGLGTLFGDYAGGAYIGELAVARSQRGFEGRGTPTILYTLILNHYGINNLLDLVDWIYEGRDLRLAELTPLVVKAAGQGDGVAREILTEVGQELGNSALTAVRRLFHPDESVSVVAMGSVFQKSVIPLCTRPLSRPWRAVYQVEPQILKLEPVAGALYGAAAQIDLAVTEEFTKRMEHSLRLFG